jgi:hypothetical protein
MTVGVVRSITIPIHDLGAVANLLQDELQITPIFWMTLKIVIPASNAIAISSSP